MSLSWRAAHNHKPEKRDESESLTPLAIWRAAKKQQHNGKNAMSGNTDGRG
jgi:hypothetical protein